MKAALARLEELQGQKLGAGENPLLVSVRSGAKFSMPGMMDTILNLGLNDKAVEALAKRSNNPRFAYDSYRRLIQMFGDVVLDVPKKKFEHIFDGVKAKKKVKFDYELQPDALKKIIAEYKKLVKKETGKDFPQNPLEQLVQARDAVFRSWQNDRAKTYRRINRIDDWLGTAVNVQAMVFGNLGENSGTGVGFTRNPATGEHTFFGEYLMNAQGEDVVSGVRTPLPISELEKAMPQVYEQLQRHHPPHGKALPRYAGLRVHHPGWQALHAADPQRQAHRPGRGTRGHRHGARRPDHAGRGHLPRRAQPACTTSWFRGWSKRARRSRFWPPACLLRRARL